MAVGNRVAELGETNFQTEDQYKEWSDRVNALLKDLSRELEDAGDHLRAALTVTPVVNSQKHGMDPRKENKTQAMKVSKALKRAATNVQSARNDTAAAFQIFIQYWTADGGLATTTSTTNAAAKNGLKLNQKSGSNRRRSASTA
jgi:hypothetical protein